MPPPVGGADGRDPGGAGRHPGVAGEPATGPGLAYLFISHDIGTVDYFSDRVAVMYLGQVVEIRPKAAVLDTPRHPYTEALLSAALPADPTEQPPHIALTGDIPSPTRLPEGCFFYSRCNYRGDPRCATENPPLREVTPGHWTATFCDVGGTASD